MNIKHTIIKFEYREKNRNENYTTCVDTYFTFTKQLAIKKVCLFIKSKIKKYFLQNMSIETYEQKKLNSNIYNFNYLSMCENIQNNYFQKKTIIDSEINKYRKYYNKK
jgi:hypothetical protein